MRGVKLDRNNPLDLHEQAAGEIRRAIADGEAKPGERLPPAKDVDAVLGVNTNTVLRALRARRTRQSPVQASLLNAGAGEWLVP
jgi:GntR family transcriptional regulator